MSEEDRARPVGTNDPPNVGKHCNGCRFDVPHATYDRFCERFKTQLVGDGHDVFRSNFCTQTDPLEVPLPDGGSVRIESAGIEIKRSENTIIVEFNGQLQATLTL